MIAIIFRLFEFNQLKLLKPVKEKITQINMKSGKKNERASLP
ncbi:hypothetical protein Cabys_4142 [Caldithrix abyssi DSM 13497]|uniref:Uncharacterized protein n=1 Tax=Caldithrix abyssi DSM 13497 TaxID=880073 RepID=A0A1J1CDY3_CALAY|nr:hypothetical protein Cabys_4142 [Caldithrix abyssi DSM 13497]